jgi:hypothetical protein
VRIPGSGRYQALLVPDSAVGTDQNQKFLLVAGPDDTVEYRLVKLGALFTGGARAIESGITENDRVIINGIQRAIPGTKVSPTETTFSANISLTAPGSPATQALPASQPATQPAQQPAQQPATQPATQPSNAP